MLLGFRISRSERYHFPEAAWSPSETMRQDKKRLLWALYEYHRNFRYLVTCLPQGVVRAPPPLLWALLSCSELSYSLHPMDCHPPGSSVHEIFPSKNIRLGCHFLLQGIFLTQRLNPHLMHWWLDFLTTVLPGKPPLLSEVKVKSLSRVWLFVTLWTVGHQAPPSMGFPRQEYWSGLPFPSPGDLPDPRIEPGSPTLQTDT